MSITLGLALGLGALKAAQKGYSAYTEQKSLRDQTKQYNRTQEQKASLIEHLAAQEGASRQQAYDFASRALAKHNMSQEGKEQALAMARQQMGDSLNRAYQARGAAAEARGNKVTVPKGPTFGSVAIPALMGAAEGAVEGYTMGSGIEGAKATAKSVDEMTKQYTEAVDLLRAHQGSMSNDFNELINAISRDTNYWNKILAPSTTTPNPAEVKSSYQDRLSRAVQGLERVRRSSIYNSNLNYGEDWYYPNAPGYSQRPRRVI